MKPDLTISVIIPVHNAENTLETCLDALIKSDHTPLEIIVVDDGSDDRSGELAKAYPVILVKNEKGPAGPAYARNKGVEQALGDILFFIDSDVVLQKNSIEIILAIFQNHPGIDAVFGSYDDTPAAGEFVSQYKNLTHHFIHQQSEDFGQTFWAGCGAVRREVFLNTGGFDARQYPQPSIEDIELGYRLRKSGSKIFVSKPLQVTHLKRWTLYGWLKTDLFSRAVPWTSLIWKSGGVQNILNLKTSQRLSSVVLIFMMLVLIFNWDIYTLLLSPLLWVLSLLLLGSCNLSERHQLFRLDRFERIIAILFPILVMGFSFLLGETQMLIPLGLLAIIPIFAQIFRIKNVQLKKFFFAGLVVGVYLSFSALALRNSLSLFIVLGLMLFAIVLLNYKLFTFFANRRGIFFSAAAVPFHLTYYLISLAGLFLGSVKYFWDTRLKR